MRQAVYMCTQSGSFVAHIEVHQSSNSELRTGNERAFLCVAVCLLELGQSARYGTAVAHIPIIVAATGGLISPTGLIIVRIATRVVALKMIGS